MAGMMEMAIIGNVGNDAELAYTKSGVAYCSFSVAVNQRWGSGEDKQEKLTWVRVTLWRGLAEALHTYLTKGTQVWVRGETIEANAWIDKAGEAKGQIQLTGSQLQLLGSAGGNGKKNEPVEPPSRTDLSEGTAPKAKQGSNPPQPDMSEIPF